MGGGGTRIQKKTQSIKLTAPGGREERDEQQAEGAGRGERPTTPHQRSPAEPDGQVQEACRGGAQQVGESGHPASRGQEGEWLQLC